MNKIERIHTCNKKQATLIVLHDFKHLDFMPRRILGMFLDATWRGIEKSIKMDSMTPQEVQEGNWISVLDKHNQNTVDLSEQLKRYGFELYTDVTKSGINFANGDFMMTFVVLPIEAKNG